MFKCRTLFLLLAVSSIAASVSHALPPCEPGYQCRCTSPIVIDLDGKGFSLTDALHGVSFDISGTGKKVQMRMDSPGSS